MTVTPLTPNDVPSTPAVCETIDIHAPIERCFALSTRIELVQRTLGMKLVDSGVAGGVTSGHITAHSRVVWKGWKFGLPVEHHTLITAFEPPHLSADDEPIAYFEDSQERGRFAAFRHEHFFHQRDQVTTLEDRIFFSLSLIDLGPLAAKFIVAPHVRKLVRQRFAMIKELAEGEDWREWVENPPV